MSAIHKKAGLRSRFFFAMHHKFAQRWHLKMVGKLNLNRLNSEWLALLELVLLPACIAMLPMRLGLVLVRFLISRFRLYKENEELGLREMERFARTKRPAEQLRLARRLTMFLDHADLYISLFKSPPWRQQRLLVQGRWPRPDEAAIIITFHWGAGFWALHHAREQGLNAHMLVNDAHPEHFAGHAIRFAYIQRRIRRIREILGHPTIDAQTNVRPVLQAIKAGQQVIAVIDVPAAAGKGAEAVPLLGRTAHVPRALLRLAVDYTLPVYVYLNGINLVDGTRTLDIHSLGTHQDVPTLATQVFELLNRAIDEQPAAWHLWSECHRFFNASSTELTAEHT